MVLEKMTNQCYTFYVSCRSMVVFYDRYFAAILSEKIIVAIKKTAPTCSDTMFTIGHIMKNIVLVMHIDLYDDGGK